MDELLLINLARIRISVEPSPEAAMHRQATTMLTAGFIAR